MRKNCPYIFATLFLHIFLLFSEVKASHIVGGDITYKYLGSNKYEVQLNLFIDCINGNPGAIRDDLFANIGVFDANYRLVDTFFIERATPVRIANTSYKCIIPPSNACVDHYVYKKEVALPTSEEGYFLVFQRCCRNRTITNLISPDSTGATFFTKIPGKSLVDSNSSPVFKSLPPNFLCVNELFNYDHSAFDADGDSLVYYYYTPYTGGTPGSSRPRPPSGPPFNSIRWRNPYNGQFPMGANSPILIDRFTGDFNLTPRTLGQFVIGIGVKEYRNGVFIGETLRDYQFNILPCQLRLKADFLAPPVFCQKEVQFTNTGEGDDFYWDFGLENTNTDTSVLKNPVFDFPDEGTYKVKLVARFGSCVDSITKEINIKLPGTLVFARADTTICGGDSVSLGVAGMETGGYNFLWSPRTGLSDPTIINPRAKPGQTTTYKVTKFFEDCIYLDSVTISVIEHKADFIYETKPECEETIVTLKNTSRNADQFLWYRDGQFITGNETAIMRLPYGKETKVWLISITDTVCTDRKDVSFYFPESYDGSALFIPNVITPDGNSANDCFIVKIIRNADLECDADEVKIFTRWGQLIFDDPVNCWDGTDQKSGKPLPPGTYYYIVKIANENYMGTVTLIR